MTINNRSGPEYLRADAEQRLRAGTAPASAGWTVGAEALSLLYRLASDPERSSDARKLLHELQTHQVELDLQHAQLTTSESELAERLAFAECLYDRAPAGFLVLAPDGRIVRFNRAAGEMLGLAEEQLAAPTLTSVLSLESRPAIRQILKAAGAGDRTEAARVETLDARPLAALAAMAPEMNAMLVMLFPTASTLDS